MKRKIQLKESDLINLIKRTINESQLLSEKYNCPCSKTCTETFYGVPTQTTYILTNAEATACNLNQGADAGAPDTCCDSAKKSTNTGEISNVDTIRRSDRDKARRRPYLAKSNRFNVNESELLLEKFACGSLECEDNQKCSYGCPTGCNDCNHSSACAVNHKCISSTTGGGPSRKKEIKEYRNGCHVMCTVAARGPGAEGEKEWCNCRSDKSKDRCCKRAGWDGASSSPVNPQVDKSDSSIRVTETELIKLINRVVNEEKGGNMKELKFKMEDIDSGYIQAKNIGFNGSKQTLINTANNVKGIVDGGGDTGHILSCPKCCHGAKCFGACGGGCCIGVKVKKKGEEVYVTVTCNF